MSLPTKIIYALMKNDGIKSSNMHHLFQLILASFCSYHIDSIREHNDHLRGKPKMIKYAKKYVKDRQKK